MSDSWHTIVVTPMGFVLVQMLRIVFSFVIGYLTALLLVPWSMEAARKHHVLAHPGHRMSHTVPTPRLGGVAIAGALFLMLAVMHAWIDVTPAPWLSALFFGGGMSFGGGLLDDLLDLPAAWKALFQVAAAGAAALAVPGPSELQLPASWLAALAPELAALASSLVSFAVAFVIVMFVMNAINFMDGMDGQAAVYGVVLAIGLLFPWFGSDPFSPGPEVFLLATLAGTLLGFTWFNHPGRAAHAKTFMGDCGSQFMGFVLALLMLRARQADVRLLPLGSMFILLVPFAWDVVYTLVRRAARGDDLFQAHRTHLYQRLLVAGWTHGQVLMLNVLVWAGCLRLSYYYLQATHAGGRNGGVVAVMGALLLMALYTLFVLNVERRREGRPQ